MKHYRMILLAPLLLLILAEIAWSWRNDKKVYQVKETLANISILAGFQLSKIIFAGYQLSLLGLASDIALFRLPHTPWIFLLCFILADLCYYWFHRASHRWQPLWAFHLIHHSSMHMNLTTAYRLNWFGALVSPLFFIPLAITGFPPEYIVASYAINLLYQFFLHTEAIGRLGKIEGIIDTPSAHRVHHGSNESYIDKNFGGVLMIWDRLFHTYQPETEKVRYGITTGFISYNPFILVFKGFIDLFKTKKPTNMYKKMKATSNRKTLFAATLLLALAAGSCKKSDSVSAGTPTVDDAADVVTEAVTPESAGMVAQTETTAVMIDNNDLSCGEERDTSFSGSNLPGATVSYSYAYSSSRLLTCNEGIPAQFAFNFSGRTSYDAPRISSSDSAKGQFTVTGLQPLATQYVFNETYIRNGSETSKVRNKLSFTSIISISTTNLTVDKSSGLIVSGTGNVTVSGATSSGRSFSYSGTITFNGNKQATLVLGNGNSYAISWS